MKEYEFSVDNLRYIVRVTDNYEIIFFTPYAKYDPFELFSTDHETVINLNEGINAVKVFNEVGKILVHHVNKYRLSYFSFSCASGRLSLYKKFAKKLSVQLNYDLVIDNCAFYFNTSKYRNIDEW